jgi:hypothetical protein
MAALFWPAVSRVGRQLIAIGNNYIKEEVEQRLLSLIVTSEGAIIRPYLISSINAFYIVIVEVNNSRIPNTLTILLPKIF